MRHGRSGFRFPRWFVRLGRCAACLCIAVLAASGAGAAEDDATLERRVKAAFLYQFASYVEWPSDSFAQPGTPVTIGVLGAEPIAAELSQVVTGRKVGGRAVSVKRVKPGDPLSGVHILFIGQAEQARIGQLALQPAMLTVTESDGALAAGSMINFVLVERRVRFEVALDSAEKGGLRLSSRLLAVAQQVRTGAP